SGGALAGRRGALEGLDLMPGFVDRSFWESRRVLLTGHTGFKGSWTALWLRAMGAEVYGLALPSETDPNLFAIVGLDRELSGGVGDIRDAQFVAETVRRAHPEIVLHMAAQPIVRRSIRAPIETFEVNVMGTARLLEALREEESVEAILVVTTDKVYENP